MPKSWSDVRPYFERAAIAHVATLLPDGAPHSVPVWVGAYDDVLTFFTIEGSLKDTNLQADPRVAVSITAPDEPLDSAFVRGRVERRLEGAEAMAEVDRISHTYTGRPYDVRSGFVAFVIRPETVWSHDYSAD